MSSGTSPKSNLLAGRNPCHSPPMKRSRLASACVVLCTLGGLAGCGDDASSGGGGSSAGGGAEGGAGGQGGGLVCDAPFVTKGPWTNKMAPTSVVVRWEACDEASEPGVVVEPEDGGDAVTFPSTVSTATLENTYTAGLSSIAPPDYAGTYYMHEAEVTGLEEGTCYHYRLVADDSREGRFCTARPAGASFTFMAIGDTNPALGSTPETLSHTLVKNPDFVLHGGDIQYYSSLLETWASWFPLMQPMLAQGAFMPAIGNHELEVPDELSDYALRFFGDSGFDGTSEYYRFQSGGVWFFNLDTEESFAEGSEQANWLEAQLADAATQPGFRFSVVYFHKPFLTCGDTGDNMPAYEHFEPIFEQYGVLFVLQAHMHGYERFELGQGPTYVTTGGGGGLIGVIDENIERAYCEDRVSSGAFYHATIFHVESDTVSAEVIDRDGAVRDTFSRSIPTP